MIEEAPEKKTLTLDQILTKIGIADDSVLELDEDEMIENGEMLRDKVDGYKSVIDYMQSRSSQLKEQIDELQKAKSALDRKQASIKSRIAMVMHFHQFDKLAGQRYQVRLGKYQKITCKSEPTAYDHKIFTDLVRVDYAWEKNKIKAKFKEEGADNLPKHMIFEETYSPIFSIKKKEAL